MNTSHSRRNAPGVRGFLLLEVLLAVAIISMGLAAVIHVFSSSLRASETSHRLTLATLLGQEKLAELRQEGFPSPGLVSGEFENYPDFSWEIEVNETELTNLADVRLTIYWHERGLLKDMSGIRCHR